MSNAVPPGIPAGWYSDPTDAAQLRWWDGSRWTSHVQQRPAPLPDVPIVPVVPVVPVVPAAPAVATRTDTPRVESEPVIPVPLEPVTSPFAADTASDASPSYWSNGTESSIIATDAARPLEETTTPLRGNTVSSWFVALSPFFYAILYIVALPVLATAAGLTLLGGELAAILVIPFVIALLFAAADHHALKKWSHPRPASVGWMFLTPLVYLIVRTIRVRRAAGRGSAPLWVWIAAWAISSAVIGVATVQILPAVTNFQNSSSLASGIQDGMNSDGGKFAVTCPPTAPLTVGSKFSCTAVDGGTRISHTLLIDVVAGADGKPTVKLESVTPPISP